MKDNLAYYKPEYFWDLSKTWDFVSENDTLKKEYIGNIYVTMFGKHRGNAKR